MEKLISKKFFYALLVLGLCFALVLMGKLSGDSFTALCEVIGGTYVVGNVASTVANNMGNPPNKIEGS